ncbi:MAG: DnaJ domain-containing protein [Chloroflexales bacterium]
MQDYYETLQVHPKADAESIRAAYARLSARYDPSKLEGAADELQALARQRRDEIERAYAVIGDATRRANYNAELADRAPVPAAAPPPGPLTIDDDDLIDYAPLPPAARQERGEGFNAQPNVSRSQTRATDIVRGRATGRSASGRMPTWLVPVLIVAVATFAIVLVTLLSTVVSTTTSTAGQTGPQTFDPNAPTMAPTTSLVEVANQFEGQIVVAKQVASDDPKNPKAWVEFGNILYDSVVVLHERLPGGDPAFQSAYVERMPRWLEAADAYGKAIALEPTNAVARADMAASLCYYGQGINDQSYLQKGIVAAEQAMKDQPQEGRALLSAGICYALASPPQTSKALEQWQKLIVLPNADPSLVFQARQLIQQYGR